MISVVEIEKNILDLRYQSELQKFNAYLIAITTGVIGFIATFLWFPEKFITGTIISLLLFIVFLALIKSSHVRLQSIMSELEQLKKHAKKLNKKQLSVQ